MERKRYRIVSAALAASLTLSMLCACSRYEDMFSGGKDAAGKDTETVEETTTTTVTEAVTEPSATPSPAFTEPETTPFEDISPAEPSLAVDTDYVRLIDGVTPEMINADYWIGPEDYEPIMDEEGIAQYNYENRVSIKANDDVTALPYLDVFPEKLDGSILRTFLNDNAGSIPTNPARYYVNGHPTTWDYWNGLIALSNIDKVPDVINVRFGFSTMRATLRMFPTEDRVFDGTSDKYYDELLYSECMPYMPCAILHESTDGEYLYVVFDSYSAWVRKEAIAICSSRYDWMDRQQVDQWLVVTAREIRLGNDPYSPATTNLVLPMGTRMELVPASGAPASINQRTTYGDYIVRIPTRGGGGFIKDEFVLIPVSDDVHVGFLPYTSANIIRQAFKLLGDRYGWGGDLQANDCTGITREIYRCFGILLPRVNQSKSKGVYKVDTSDMSTDEKLALLEDLTPGSLISFPGHMMIYLGTVDGTPYVISAVGTFVAPAPGSTDKIHPNSVIINSLYVRRANLSTWLDSVTTVLTIRMEE